MREITTERLLLTPWKDCREDAEGLYAYASDPEVGPRAGWKPHASVEESREIIKNVFMPHTVWAIREKESGRIIGSIGLEPDRRREDVNSKEMGYSLGRSFWGNGYMTEAAEAVMDYGFREFDLAVMGICTSPDNNRSQRTETGRNTLIVDCYNANPSSMRASVANFLAEPPGMRTRRLLILGDMLELGAWSAEEHAAVIRLAAQAPQTEVMLVGQEFAKARADMEPQPARITLFADREHLIAALRTHPCLLYTSDAADE